MPNLASRAMGLALRQLPDQWQEKHGYRPLLAETFTDVESFEGTCYKASNWQSCGLTKGFAPPTAPTSTASTSAPRNSGSRPSLSVLPG